VLTTVLIPNADQMRATPNSGGQRRMSASLRRGCLWSPGPLRAIGTCCATASDCELGDREVCGIKSNGYQPSRSSLDLCEGLLECSRIGLGVLISLARREEVGQPAIIGIIAEGQFAKHGRELDSRWLPQRAASLARGDNGCLTSVISALSLEM
jgi:hypothetical protein